MLLANHKYISVSMHVIIIGQYHIILDLKNIMQKNTLGMLNDY